MEEKREKKVMPKCKILPFPTENVWHTVTFVWLVIQKNVHSNIYAQEPIMFSSKTVLIFTHVHTILQQGFEGLHNFINFDLEEFPQFDLWKNIFPKHTANSLKHKVKSYYSFCFMV